MKYERLKNVKRVLLSIGHCAGHDLGACNDRGDNENEEATEIAWDIKSGLEAQGIECYLLPDYTLQNTCDLINKIGHIQTDMAIEIHKDSTDNYTPLSMRRRVGFYFHPKSYDADAIAANLVNVAKEMGAAKTSWTRPDTDSHHKQLAFIRQPKMLSFIYEAGFIQDINTEDERQFYASVLVKGIVHILEK